MFEKNTVLKQNEDVILTELEDEKEGVLLHLKTKFYFTLNETGVFLWKVLNDRNIANVIEELYSNYELSREQAENTVKNFVKELLDHELIKIVD